MLWIRANAVLVFSTQNDIPFIFVFWLIGKIGSGKKCFVFHLCGLGKRVRCRTTQQKKRARPHNLSLTSFSRCRKKAGFSTSSPLSVALSFVFTFQRVSISCFEKEVVSFWIFPLFSPTAQNYFQQIRYSMLSPHAFVILYPSIG